MPKIIKNGVIYSGVPSNLASKMDVANPTGTGSFSMNRKANTTVGMYSTTEGYENTASAYCSHAEGRNNTADAAYSHAEGNQTLASGVCACRRV